MVVLVVFVVDVRVLYQWLQYRMMIPSTTFLPRV